MTGIYSEHDRAATDDGDPHNDDDRDARMLSEMTVLMRATLERGQPRYSH